MRAEIWGIVKYIYWYSKYSKEGLNLNGGDSLCQWLNFSVSIYSASKGLEDAERRYQELFEAERQRLHKKEQESKEIIVKLQKKLKVS